MEPFDESLPGPLASVFGFKITLTGVGGHGSMPEACIDPINTGVHIYLALQELIARECPPEKEAALTIGQFSAGSASNIIPQQAVLQSFDTRFNVVDDSAHSMLAMLGSFIAPLFAPLGFGNWMASTALVTGLTAKEAVVSTLTVLTGAADSAGLAAALGQIFAPKAALSFLVFTLLYMPCVAAFAAIRREYGSGIKAVGIMAAQTGIAWCVAFCVYHIALMF